MSAQRHTRLSFLLAAKVTRGRGPRLKARHSRSQLLHAMRRAAPDTRPAPLQLVHSTYPSVRLAPYTGKSGRPSTARARAAPATVGDETARASRPTGVPSVASCAARNSKPPNPRRRTAGWTQTCRSPTLAEVATGASDLATSQCPMSRAPVTGSAVASPATTQEADAIAPAPAAAPDDAAGRRHTNTVSPASWLAIRSFERSTTSSAAAGGRSSLSAELSTRVPMAPASTASMSAARSSSRPVADRSGTETTLAPAGQRATTGSAKSVDPARGGASRGRAGHAARCWAAARSSPAGPAFAPQRGQRTIDGAGRPPVARLTTGRRACRFCAGPRRVVGCATGPADPVSEAGRDDS